MNVLSRNKEDYPIKSPCITCSLPLKVACERRVPSRACDNLWSWLSARGDWVMGVEQLELIQ